MYKEEFKSPAAELLLPEHVLRTRWFNRQECLNRWSRQKEIHISLW